MTPGVVIVGAGPAGLAVARTLGDHGVPYTLLERAPQVGAAWRARYDGLRLHTVRWLSDLPGMRIPRRSGRWVSRDGLVGYLESYARGLPVPPELGVEVTRIDRADHGWLLETSAGRREAAEVVLATGYSRTRYLPDWPGRDTFPGPLHHSADYRRPDGYAGLEVLVVGAGNSAAEIAVELARVAARVYLSVRTPPNIVRRDVLGIPSQLMGVALRRVPERLMNLLTAALRRLTVPDLTAQGLPAPPGDGFTQFLRTRTVPILDHGFVSALRAGRITVVAPIDRFQGSQVRLVDGSTRHVDAVVVATGFRPDLAGLVGHLGVLDSAGVPTVHGAHTLMHAPGLYVVGISVELAGLLREIGLEARAVAEAITDRHRG